MVDSVPKPIAGYYRYTDVIDQIVNIYHLSPSVQFQLIGAMARSILKRELITRDTKTGLPVLEPDPPTVYVTELDAKKWLQSQMLPYIWSPGQPNRHPSTPDQRGSEIIKKIVELGHDPQDLPKAGSGKAGVKSKVKNSLGKKGIWVGSTVFNKAWEKLRANGEISGA